MNRLFKSTLLFNIVFSVSLIIYYRNDDYIHGRVIECNNEPKVTSYNTNSCVKYRKEFSVIIDGQKYPKRIPQYYNKSIDFECLEKLNTAKKTILLWTNFYGVPLQDSLKQKIIDKPSNEVLKELNCPVTNCILTYDRKKYQESSLVLFHMRNEIDYYPSFKCQNQRWVNLSIYPSILL